MTIKKQNPAAANAGAATGGATIADRFKLEPTAPVAATGSVSKQAATWAFVAGLLGLLAVGILTFILYKHWEYLMPA